MGLRISSKSGAFLFQKILTPQLQTNLANKRTLTFAGGGGYTMHFSKVGQSQVSIVGAWGRGGVKYESLGYFATSHRNLTQNTPPPFIVAAEFGPLACRGVALGSLTCLASGPSHITQPSPSKEEPISISWEGGILCEVFPEVGQSQNLILVF